MDVVHMIINATTLVYLFRKPMVHCYASRKPQLCVVIKKDPQLVFACTFCDAHHERMACCIDGSEQADRGCCLPFYQA